MIDVNTIGIGVDTREVKSAVTDLDRLGKAADNASRKADGLDDSSKRLEKSTHALSGALGLATRAFGALGVGLLAKEFISASDAMTKMRGQLSNATKSQEEFNAALSSVRSIANQVQSDLGSIGTVYARLSNALQDMGASQQQVTDVTKTMALALRVNGASAAETSSALLQLSQAFGAGKLSGDEFRSAMESAPNLMRELAKSIGVPVGQLKELAANGQITSDILLKAFSNPELLKSLEAQNEKMKTISGSWQNLQNRLVNGIDIIDKRIGASKFIIKFIDSLGTLASVTEGGEKGSVVRNALDSSRSWARTQFEKMDLASLRLEAQSGNDLAQKIYNDRTRTGRPVLQGRITQDYMGAPSFSVEKKEGAGGYDARSYKDFKSYEDAAKKQKDLRDKANEQALKDLQDQVTEEFEANEAIYKYKFDKEKDFAEFKKKQEKELNNEVEKHLKAIQRSENKILDEKHKKEKDALEKLSRQQEQMARELSQAFTNGLFDSFKKGESFGKSMIRNLAALAQTWLSRMIQGLFTGSGGIVSTLGSLLGGTFSTNAFAGGSVITGTGSNSIFGQLSSIKDLLGGGNNFITGSIEKLGAWIANGQGGIADSIGGALGQYSGAISDALGYAGAAFQLAKGNVAGAALTAVGTYFGGPFGGAIGGLLGSAFGGSSLPKRNWSEVRSEFGEGKFKLTGNFAKREGAGALAGQEGLQQAFAASLGSLLQSFGVNDNFSLSSNFSTRPGKKTKATFVSSIAGITDQMDFQYGKKDQNAWSSFVDSVLGGGLSSAIKNSKLPEGIKKFFDGLTKKEDVQESITSIIGLKTALKDMPSVFNQVRDALDATAYKISIHDLKKLFSDTQTYTSLFYTQQENFDTFTKQLTSQFTELNATLPATRDGFRALVDGLMNDFSESGRKQFAGLVALSGAADAYYKQLVEQKGALEGLNAAYFSTSADYMSAAASASNGVTYTNRIGELSVTRRAGDSELIAAIRELLASNADTKAVLEAVAYATQQTARIQRTWNGDGLPETRVI